MQQKKAFNCRNLNGFHWVFDNPLHRKSFSHSGFNSGCFISSSSTCRNFFFLNSAFFSLFPTSPSQKQRQFLTDSHKGNYPAPQGPTFYPVAKQGISSKRVSFSQCILVPIAKKINLMPKSHSYFPEEWICHKGKQSSAWISCHIIVIFNLAHNYCN